MEENTDRERQMRSRDRSDTLKQPMLSVSLGAAELSGCTHSHMHKHTHTHICTKL